MNGRDSETSDIQFDIAAPSLHFIVAENPDPEPVEPSAWFAVDQPREKLLQLLWRPTALSRIAAIAGPVQRGAAVGDAI